MIHGTRWTEERAARIVEISAPPGYRFLTSLEECKVGDLQLGYDGAASPLHPANLGRRAGAVVAACRRGSGLDRMLVEPARPEDFLTEAIRLAP